MSSQLRLFLEPPIDPASSIQKHRRYSAWNYNGKGSTINRKQFGWYQENKHLLITFDQGDLKASKHQKNIWICVSGSRFLMNTPFSGLGVFLVAQEAGMYESWLCGIRRRWVRFLTEITLSTTALVNPV